MKLNKAAMFGLCRELKKQSSELFLASRHSVDSQETRGSVKATRGAMFGLDARIALAIFGALSVISGAALYSAIQNAKVIALLADLNEIDKAGVAYLLDTGENVPFTAASSAFRDVGMLGIDGLILKRNSQANVPYLPYEDFNSIVGHDYILKYSTAGQELYMYAKENSSWSSANATAGTCKSSSLACNTYICVWGIPDELKKAMETKIDGTETPGDYSDSGNVRYNKASNSFCLKGSKYNPKQSPIS